MRSVTKRRLCTAVTCLCAFFMGSAQQLVQGADLVGSPEELRGDIEGLEARWWRTVNDAPDSLEAQAALFLWGQSLGALPAPARDAAAWRELYDAIGSNGWSQRAALWQLRHHLRREGNVPEAQALPITAGSPRNWFGIGPFGRTGSTALHRSYPPEAAFDRAARYDVDGLEVFWRPVHVADGSTSIQPGDEWRRRGGAYYLRSVFSLDADFEGLLQTAGGASLRVWIDGTEICTVDRHRDNLPAVVRTGVALTAGTHELLIKCDGTRFNVLFRDVNGYPLDLRAGASDQPVTDRATATLRPGIRPQNLLTHDWWQAWKSGDSTRLNHDQTLALALVLLAEGRSVDSRRVLQRFEAEVGVTVPYAMAVTRAYDDLDYLPGEWRENWCARVWEKALSDDPKVVPIRIAQAEEFYAEDRTDDAMALLRAVLADQPRSLSALLLVEELCHHREWRNERLQALQQLQTLAPKHSAVLGRWIRRWEEVGRSQQAAPHRLQRYANSPDANSARSLIDMYRRLGQRDQALALTRELAQLAGHSTDSLVSQYQIFEELGAYDDALAVIEKLIPRIPDDDRQYNARAKLMWQKGELQEALASYQRALELTPGQIVLFQRIEQLERELGFGTEPARFWKKYDRSLDAIVADAPAPDAYPGAGAVYLFDLMVSRVGAQGGIEEYVHQVIRIDSAQAVEEHSEFTVGGEALSIRVITPDGEELHPTSGDGSGGYTLPGLTPGALIDYETIMRRNVGQPEKLELGPFYFQDPGLGAAFHHTEWVVLLPDGWNPTIREKNLPFERREQQLDNGYRELVWRGDRMDRPTPEPLAPPADEIVPNVWLHAELDWEPTLEEMLSGTAGADFTTPELEAATAEILSSVPATAGVREKALALHAATCERITGDLGGSNATDIWMTRAGDRDVLLAGLLRTAGIPYRELRIATRDAIEPFRDWSLPSSDYFTYPLLEVPLESGAPLILSTRYRMANASDYPTAYHGGRAVRLEPWGAEWVTLPRPPAKEADTVLHTTVALGADGTTRIAGSVVQHAVDASTLKERVKDIPQSQQQMAAEQFVGQMLPGARLQSGGFPELATPGRPFEIAFDATSDQLLQPANDQFVLRAVHFPASLRRQYGGQPQRVHPLVNPAAITMVETSTIDLGDYRLVGVPSSVTLSGPWGSYQLRYRAEAGAVHLFRRLELQPCVLTPAECPGFMEACTKIDQCEAERLRLER